MPSPDVAAYFGLELIALDEQTLIDTALANGVEAFPDWTPREDNTEVVVLEQVAAMVTNLGYVIEQLPNGIAEVLLRYFGLNRDPGQPPTAIVRFVLSDAVGHTIPAGTTVRLNLGDNVDPLDFVTDADLVVAAADSEGTVLATATEATSIGNGTTQASNPSLTLLDAIAYVDGVALEGPVTGGTDAEDQAAFLARIASTLGRLTTTLVRPDDVTAYVAAAFPSITRVKVLDLFYITPGTAGTEGAYGPPGTTPGSFVIVVAGSGGSEVTDTLKAQVLTQVRNRTHAGLNVAITGPDRATIDVAVTVTRTAASVSADVEAAVLAALAGYLSPDTWGWSSTVVRNNLIALVDNVPGVDTVDALTLALSPDALDSGDLLIDGYYAILTVLGDAAITVNGPS